LLPDNAIALLYCLVRWSCRALPPGVHNVRATIYMLSLMNLMGTVRGFGHVLAPLFLLTFTPVGAVWDPALVVDDQCTPTRTIWGAVGIERIRPRCGLRCRWRLCVARLNGSSAVACRLNVGSGSKLFQPLETPSIARGDCYTRRHCSYPRRTLLLVGGDDVEVLGVLVAGGSILVLHFDHLRAILELRDVCQVHTGLSLTTA